MSTSYPNTNLYIDGRWQPAASGDTIDVINPANEEVIGTVARAGTSDLDEALSAADKAFKIWKNTSAFDRYKILRKAADLLRKRADIIAQIMTIEQGKPLAESKGETLVGADRIDWMAEEGRRTYGRVIPARADGIYQFTVKEPVGPVAAFTPWNFPLNQILQKVPAAIAAGCSIIVKGPEEAPACCAELAKVFEEAGLPAGVFNLVYGVPSEISDYLIPHPIIKKVTFTGSTAVGKLLAAKAGEHMKLVTMELGGHSPAIVCEDADVDVAVKILSANKFRNAGQVCISPARFYIHEKKKDEFAKTLVEKVSKLKIGNGMDDDTILGPLTTEKRLNEIEALVEKTKKEGATVLCGGKRPSGFNKGYFYEPTVFDNVQDNFTIAKEEPFGPLVPLLTFKDTDEVVERANDNDLGLASYIYTNSLEKAHKVSEKMETGTCAVNHPTIAFAEVPFGGIKQTGYGREGGSMAIKDYLNIKYTHFGLNY